MTIITSVPNIFQNFSVADAVQVNADFSSLIAQINQNAANINQLPPLPVVPNVQLLTASGGTYTTPLSAASKLPLYLKVRMVGGGAGGGGSGTSAGSPGGAGTLSFFGSFQAAGGSAGAAFNIGGVGGSGLGGSANRDVPGGTGETGVFVGTIAYPSAKGGFGGGSGWMGAPTPGNKSAAGSTGSYPGAGGSGAAAAIATIDDGGGGGGGEYVEIWILAPAASYSYGCGPGGAGGAGGSLAGGAGAAGAILVEAYYQ